MQRREFLLAEEVAARSCHASDGLRKALSLSPFWMAIHPYGPLTDLAEREEDGRIHFTVINNRTGETRTTGRRECLRIASYEDWVPVLLQRRNLQTFAKKVGGQP